MIQGAVVITLMLSVLSLIIYRLFGPSRLTNREIIGMVLVSWALISGSVEMAHEILCYYGGLYYEELSTRRYLLVGFFVGLILYWLPRKEFTRCTDYG